jgi:hypothetical protein
MREEARHREAHAAVRKHFAGLIGRRIVSVAALNRKQSVAIGFDDATIGMNPVLAITLDNGVVVVPTADPEGNGPGWMEVLARQE